MNINYSILLSLLAVGLAIAVNEISDEYLEIKEPLSSTGYETEKVIKPIVMDDEQDDEQDEDDDYENNEYNSDDNYDNYEDENAEKRDIIKGPSFTPNIDDDVAESDIDQENFDTDEKRKFIDRPDKKKSSLFESGRDKESYPDDVKTAANENDVSDAIEEKPVVSVSKSASQKDFTPEDGKTTVATKKSKGKINVLVNVNINERPARRSKVNQAPDKIPESTFKKEFDTSKKSGFLQQYGALQKLRGDQNAEESGSGSSDLLESNAGIKPDTGMQNSTVTMFSGLAFPNENHVKIIKVVNGSETSDNDDEDHENLEDEIEQEEKSSGSGDSEGDDVSSKANDKGPRKHPKFAHVEKEPGVVVSKMPLKPLTQKLRFHKKYHPTHAYEENAEAEKGETPDTVFASKIAADREEKDNELEHNDNNLETVTMVKEKQNQELEKSVEDEVSTNAKSKTNGVSKTLDSETEELSHTVKLEKLKPLKAEEVSIEQLKQNTEDPKHIPNDGDMDTSHEKATEQLFNKSGAADKEDEENDEILFTKKERKEKAENEATQTKNDIKKKKNENTDDKYETLEEVREKFKTWENRIQNNKDDDSKSEKVTSEMAGVVAKDEKKHDDDAGDKTSTQLEKEDHKKKQSKVKHAKKMTEKEALENPSDTVNNSTTTDEPKTWKEEEKMLLEKLKNPYLSEKTTKSKADDDSDDDEEESKKQILEEKEASDIKKSANAAFSTVVENITSGSIEKSQDKKDEQEVTDSADKAFTSVVEKITSKTTNDTPEISLGASAFKKNADTPKVETIHVTDVTNKTAGGNDKNLKKLQAFKEQILSEVTKIDNLQGEYGNNGKSAKDLKDAKDVLQKDLNVVKNLELNLQKKIKKEKKKSKKTSKIKQYQKAKHTAAFSKEASKFSNQEIIPDSQLGFDGPKSKLKKVLKKAMDKKHPLEEIKSLLKAEIRRLKHKGDKADKQLIMIRGLVQQKIKDVIKNGDLDKTAFHKLAPDIKELGSLLKARIKNENTKSKKGHHSKHIKGGNLKNKKIEMMKEPAAGVLPMDKFDAKTQGNQGSTVGTKVDQQMNKVQSELNKVNEISSKGSQQSTDRPVTNDLTQASKHIETAQNVFKNIQNANVTLDPSKSNQMKNLLSSLNQKLGEIYSKTQQATGATLPNNQQQQYGQQMNASSPYQSMTPLANSVNPANPLTPINQNGAAPLFIPQTYTGTSSKNVVSDPYHQVAQGKHNLPSQPSVEEEIAADENKKALADDEPVNTLVENLERDITEVWSYRDMFPDSDALGLDNEKVHNTYANLGSLSGLSLRRALNRALRGEDVGLAVVGGSISKGGPFSEKGLDFVLRSYFYAIEDYWNKIIRPVTGSSMIIRDVSIGGIATDYYSYCLQNHLPDDKLTNIVLWELSANDMKRYEDSNKPKQQPLEQFTRNVLSYKAKPALIFVNFFALFDWDPELSAHCRNYEDEGEDDVARYYKITSLSWRNMVCPLLKDGNQPLFTRSNLFAEDNFHPSILAHAQMSYITIDYIRTEFLKNLVKMRGTYIADAVTRLQIPKSIYVPRPMYHGTYQWKPLCYTYMLVDNRSPNNTLSMDEENNSNFRYTVVREFKIRSDKIVGMETQNKDQYIRYRAHIPVHPSGSKDPYKQMGIMTFTDDRFAQVQFDNEPARDIDSKKRFLEGTVIKNIAENVHPGDHTLTVRSGGNGFLICAIVLG